MLDAQSLDYGEFIYHCAVPNLDLHIGAEIFDVILVEPEIGVSEVN